MPRIKTLNEMWDDNGTMQGVIFALSLVITAILIHHHSELVNQYGTFLLWLVPLYMGITCAITILLHMLDLKSNETITLGFCMTSLLLGWLILPMATLSVIFYVIYFLCVSNPVIYRKP